LPIFIELLENSDFTPQVPSWPEQRSTVDLRIGHEFEHLARLLADVLHAQVAGDVVRDLAERLPEIGLQQAVACCAARGTRTDRTSPAARA
jgi:hypothetical protein